LINKWNNLRHPSSEFSAFAMGRQKSRGLMLVINEAGQFDELKSAVFVFPRKRKDAIADASSLKQALKKQFDCLNTACESVESVSHGLQS